MPPPLASLLLGAERYTVRQTEIRLPVAWSSVERNAKSSSRLISSSTSAARPTRSLLKRKPVKLSDGIDFNLETLLRAHEHSGAEYSTKRYAKKTRTDSDPEDEKNASTCGGFVGSLLAVKPTTPRLPDAAPTDTPSKGMPHLGSRPIAVVANEIDSLVHSQPCLLNCGYAECEIDWKSERQSKPPPSTEIFHDPSTATSDETLDTSPGNCLTSDDWDIIYDTAQDVYGMEARTQLESQGEFRRSTRIVTPHKRRTPRSRREPLLVHTPPSGSNNLKCTQATTTASLASFFSDVPTELAPGTASATCSPPKDYPCNPEEICTLIPCCSLCSKASVHIICATKENSEAIGKPTNDVARWEEDYLSSSSSSGSNDEVDDDDVVDVVEDEENGGSDKENGDDDYDGPSEYERLRLNSIRRNRGLLTPDKNDKSNNATSSSSSDAAATAAEKRKRSVAATAPRRSQPGRHGRDGDGDVDDDVESLPSLTSITRVLRPQPHQAELDESHLHSNRSDAMMNLCNHDGCINNARHRGLCIAHGGKVKSCIHKGCTNGAVKGQVCKKHGAKKDRKRCSHAGCTNQIQKGGVCWRHGARMLTPPCSHDGCTNNALKGGVCCRHGAKIKRCGHKS